jgi:hypothetical protein
MDHRGANSGTSDAIGDLRHTLDRTGAHLQPRLPASCPIIDTDSVEGSTKMSRSAVYRDLSHCTLVQLVQSVDELALRTHFTIEPLR